MKPSLDPRSRGSLKPEFFLSMPCNFRKQTGSCLWVLWEQGGTQQVLSRGLRLNWFVHRATSANPRASQQHVMFPRAPFLLGRGTLDILRDTVQNILNGSTDFFVRKRCFMPQNCPQFPQWREFVRTKESLQSGSLRVLFSHPMHNHVNGCPWLIYRKGDQQLPKEHVSKELLSGTN